MNYDFTRAATLFTRRYSYLQPVLPRVPMSFLSCVIDGVGIGPRIHTLASNIAKIVSLSLRAMHKGFAKHGIFFDCVSEIFYVKF